MTDYERSHRQAVLDLVFNSRLVYTHLDWHDTSQWLDTQQSVTRLAWQQNQIVGCMAVSTPLSGTCWLRIAALSPRQDAQAVIQALWEAIQKALQAAGVQTVCALIADEWILDYLPTLGFAYHEDIITLNRPNHHPLPSRKSPAVQLRTANLDDIDRLLQVDHAAFAAPWQLSLMELRQARRIAALCRIALSENGEVVGYQLSTLYNQAGHLARLAVIPTCQGQGIASVLLEDLILRFQQRHIGTLTVNTQASNHRSQQLYERYGFYRNGYDLPVWAASLKE